MNRTYNIIEMCCISGVIGVIMRLIGGIEITYIILITLVIIDTLTGMAVAFKYRRFSSRGLSKLTKKMISYTACVVTVRLLELGVEPLVKTNMLSFIMVAFLEATEAISTLENLTILGVPIPSGFFSYLLEHLKIPGLNEMIKKGIASDKTISEIDEIIKYQLPLFEDCEMRQILEAYFIAWRDIASRIQVVFRENNRDNGELMYYKILTFVKLEITEMEQQWKDEKISQQFIEMFLECHAMKTTQWIDKAKNICLSNECDENIKDQLLESLVTMLYKTVLEGFKCVSQINEETR